MTSLATWLVRSGLGEAATGELPPPGVEVLLDALEQSRTNPADAAAALAIFAWENAGTVGDLTCAMTELNELWDMLESTGDEPFSRDHAHHYLVDAWVDAVAAERGSPGVDALSGLHTVGYLYGRVHELDRAADEENAPLMLIVMRWDLPAGPWMRIARVLHVASTLRRHVRPQATLSQVGPHMAVALVPDDARSRRERISLMKEVETGELSIANMRVDVFAVPDARSRLPELVTRLSGQDNVDLAAGSPSSDRWGHRP